jgi:hypothetical protein
LQPAEGTRVIKLNTLLRVVYTLGLSLILSQFVSAQPAQAQGSVLNFVKATVNSPTNTGFAVTNPTSTYADVQFSFYGTDGSLVTKGLANNPVRYRVAPQGQISMFASDIFGVFGASTVDGWVQVTSPTAGLVGSYMLGDFSGNLQGNHSDIALSTQVIPLVRSDSAYDTQIALANPNSGTNNTATVNIDFYGATGQPLTSTQATVAPHGFTRVSLASLPNLPADYVSARITSAVSVVATAIVDRSGTYMFVEGQSASDQSAVRIAPHFVSATGFVPTLVLSNPTNSAVPVKVTLFSATGGAVDPSLNGPSVISFSIPPFGVVSKSTTDLVGRVFFTPPSIDGWLRIDTQNVALNGVVVLDRGQGLTAEPLATAAPTGMYPEVFENQSATTGLVLVNPSAGAATADLYLVKQDGATVAHNTVTIPATSKQAQDLRVVFPNAQNGNYLFVSSSTPLYSVSMIYSTTTGFIASLPPAPSNSVPSSFAPNTNIAPLITSVDPGTDVQSSSTIRVSVASSSGVTFWIDNQVLKSVSAIAFGGSPAFSVTLPALDPGYVTLRAQSNGVNSPPVLLHVLQPDGSATQPVSGIALYQKIDVTDSGLDLADPVMFPIRNARVEVVDPGSQAVLSVSATDDQGRFTVAVPNSSNLIVQVISRIRAYPLQVEDNTNLNAWYPIQAIIDGTAANSGLLLYDKNRPSGAFNILEVVQRANDLLKSADPTLQPTPVTIFWSVNNTKTGVGNPAKGLIGTSEFNLANNTAYILGDRNTDSDEYDDAVIAHEYAHMLAAKYSRDDSPGGPHSLGDMLDPRLAWSEGWANFFSSAVRNDPVWRDSMGPTGALGLRYDLSDSSSTGDPNKGYYSEASVDTLLWALEAGLDSDGVRYPFSSIWKAFTALQSNTYVYLPQFLDHFIVYTPSATTDIVNLAHDRLVYYQPGATPPAPDVQNPFPIPVNVGAAIGPDRIDSYTLKRTDLMTSSHFYTFTTTGGATTIRMVITGPGPANNPNANDLDLFLYNGNGKFIAVSDSGGNGQPERIATPLGPGTYVVEVRSYYTNGDTGQVVYNSGDFTLSISVQ